MVNANAQNASRITRMDASVSRHRRDVRPLRIVLLSAPVDLRQRLQGILRRAGHSISATDDHEVALDIMADTRPNLAVVAVEPGVATLNVLQHIRLLKSAAQNPLKVVALGDRVPSGLADAVIPSASDEGDLLLAVESLVVKP